MKKSIDLLICTLSFVFLLGACTPHSNQASGNIERKQSFDFDWRFALGEQPNAENSNFDDSGWRQLDLPHDWSIEDKIAPDNPTGNDGGYFPAGIGWYRKSFTIPKEWNGEKIGIYFEGVYMNSEVFINGKSLGVHPYGYTSFDYDLTSFIRFGKENILAVRVDNSLQKNCRWYSGSGIYRHVWLTVNTPVHIAHWGVAITAPAITTDSATVEIKTIVKNETGKQQTIRLVTELMDKNSDRVGSGELSIEMASNSQEEVTQSILVHNPMLWTPDSPELYTANSIIQKDGNEIDKVANKFGIRTINYSAEKGFELNGKTIKLNGGCVHHDNGVLGAAAYDRAEERKVELLKDAGFNAVRTSHNPPSEAFLDACDRLGLLVIDEAFDGWRQAKDPTPHDYSTIFDENWQSDLEAMVLRDRNHPSIVMWSSGNEIMERTSPEAVKTAHMLNSHIRELDPTRPVTSAMCSWNQGWEIFDPLMAEHDICGYNYMMHESESDHKRVPNRVILQTESYPKDAFYNWQMVHNNDYIIGDFVWTAMDYLGESSIGRYYYPWEPEGQHWERNFFPWHGAYCGDIDLNGWRKPISHYRNLLWNDTEKLYLAVREPNPAKGAIKTTMWAVWPTWESWNWPGFENENIDVEVYSKYPIVRLYLNDKLIGEKQTGLEQKYKATFSVPYAPGTLKAVGIDGGKNEVETTVLKTAGEPSQLKLSADRQLLKANGQDLSYVTVEVTDAEGNLVPNAENKLEFSIRGEGVIAGVGNANLKSTEQYVSDQCTVWNGRAQVVVRSPKNPGELVLNVSSPGLEGAEIQIRSN
ncbi:sugar-binding domain-containing protein [Mangrovibacterium diazotrophicum]|uniref:Beta-galactosidase n=1 Tax=Mangrovibacterium diazotrophicum TaxID=1261403 RepID=A0A419W633_9BACT|nr:sugar-binding domain-containing protein [Mangrovibacterium diazotrophicum]RKD90904.1 beta-galactosidase [Mangrovibacterium diazotrophicum]